MPVKTDRNDARGIAQLMRLGWFRPVHCKSMAAQEVRALLTARKLVQSKLYDIEMSLRGILRGFGLKVGPTPLQRVVGAFPRMARSRTCLVSAANLEPVFGPRRAWREAPSSFDLGQSGMRSPGRSLKQLHFLGHQQWAKP
jgi:hypothetical protein